MPSRDQRLLFTLAVAFSLGLLAQELAGLTVELLYVAPLVLLALPLIGGRYIGEDRLLRAAEGRRPVGRRRPEPRKTLPRPARAFPRGGRLIATGLAVRPPPPVAALV
jgi:hypothetical protein